MKGVDGGILYVCINSGTGWGHSVGVPTDIEIKHNMEERKRRKWCLTSRNKEQEGRNREKENTNKEDYIYLGSDINAGT
jgi:hypothetical protein